jgi:hypothetical protein
MIPTFHLKWINPNEVKKEYAAGVFNVPIEAAISSRSKFKLLMKREILAPVYTSDETQGIYCVRDRMGGSAIYVSTEQEAYTTHSLTGELKTKGRCLICTRDIEKESAGYPLVETEEVRVIDNVYRIFHVFWTVGSFDTYRCTKRYCRIMKKENPLIANAEKLLHRMLEYMYPGVDIREAPDPMLLLCNGGSLTDEQWDDSKVVYKPTARLILLPLKEEYLKKAL